MIFVTKRLSSPLLPTSLPVHPFLHPHYNSFLPALTPFLFFSLLYFPSSFLYTSPSPLCSSSSLLFNLSSPISSSPFILTYTHSFFLSSLPPSFPPHLFPSLLPSLLPRSLPPSLLFSLRPFPFILLQLLYSAKFLRRIIFTVFADSSHTTKIKFFKTFQLNNSRLCGMIWKHNNSDSTFAPLHGRQQQLYCYFKANASRFLGSPS